MLQGVVCVTHRRLEVCFFDTAGRAVQAPCSRQHAATALMFRKSAHLGDDVGQPLRLQMHHNRALQPAASSSGQTMACLKLQIQLLLLRAAAAGAGCATFGTLCAVESRAHCQMYAATAITNTTQLSAASGDCCCSCSKPCTARRGALPCGCCVLQPHVASTTHSEMQCAPSACGR